MASAHRLARLTGRRFRVCWRPQEECGAALADLFETPFEEVSVEGLKEPMIDLFYRDRIFDNGRGIELLENRIRRGDMEWHVAIESCGYVAFKDERVANHAEQQPENFRREVQEWHRSLRPVAAVRQRVEEAAGLFAARTIGFHIRRTDHRHAIQYSPLDGFVRRMDEIARQEPETAFFLATDCQQTEDMVMQRFGDRRRGGRVIVIEKPYRRYLTASRFPNRDHPQAVRDALADILTLARTPYVIGSHSSTFTWSVGLFGGQWRY